MRYAFYNERIRKKRSIREMKVFLIDVLCASLALMIVIAGMLAGVMLLIEKH